ncbi:MAG: N-acetylmuramic acid 6-phosphate etherase [Peptostreptococcaceae bacterium]
MKIELNKLQTEQQNENSINIDISSTSEILKVINDEDKKVAYAVEECLEKIEDLIDLAYERMKKGGRIIYVGAGTSGRLGVLDASECPPTYGVSYELVQGVIAGGYDALLKSKEGAEDSEELGQRDMISLNVNQHDTVIGLAASGRTPFVIGALKYANEAGALTGAIGCVKNSEISKYAKVGIEVLVGAEVVTGSTRMKSGTAQKMILNMISTSLMIKSGKVYKNLMVDIQPTNDKLVERSKRIISLSTDCSYERASELLEKSNYDVKIAICIELTDYDVDRCKDILAKNDNNVSRAIRSLK